MSDMKFLYEAALDYLHTGRWVEARKAVDDLLWAGAKDWTFSTKENPLPSTTEIAEQDGHICPSHYAPVLDSRINIWNSTCK